MRRLFILSSIVVTLSGPAFAQMTATAITDLNLRTGPGPQYQIAGVIPASGAVTVEGCLTSANWCRVNYQGTAGWAFGDYLTTMMGSQATVLMLEPARRTVTVIDDNEAAQEQGAAVVGGFGAIAGALIAGPPGAAVGAVAGAAAGGMATPDERVRTFVVDNPVEPVFLEGEAVVGAGIPDTVLLYPIPNTTYSYIYLNGQPVIVQNEGRVIAHVVR